MKKRIVDEIVKFFPEKLRQAITKADLSEIEEFRLRMEKPVILRKRDREIYIYDDNKKYILTKEELLKVFEAICGNSVYAYQQEMSNGFITIFGGHRVGICGKPLYKDGKVYSMRDISGLNIRVARQVIGCADRIKNEIMINNEFTDTLIVSPPGFGKTTILRDLARQISNSGKNVGIIDERSEIASSFRGVPQNDVGERTDIMDGVYKADGIKMLVRSMRPDFIITDEIGTREDIEAILYAVNSGVKICATAHGADMEDLKRRDTIYRLIENKTFKKVVFLNAL